MPYAQGDEVSVEFEQTPVPIQDSLVESVARKYNVRSDYPEKVAAMFDHLRGGYYSDLLGD